MVKIIRRYFSNFYKIFLILLFISFISIKLIYSQITPPESIKELLEKPWDTTSLNKAINMLKNPEETEGNRYSALRLLTGNKRKMSKDELILLLNEVTIITKNPKESVRLSALSISVISEISLLLFEREEISREEEIKEKEFLIDTAKNRSQDLLLRHNSIKAIDILKIKEAIPVLQEILRDSNNLNVPEITRVSCFAFLHLAGDDSLPEIKNILYKTETPSIFSTAAYCLGQIKTDESIFSLVDNSERFTDTGACDFALVDMENVILEMLEDPNNPNLIYAIKATKYLWKDGQREKYIPLLLNLLSNSSLESRKIAIGRLRYEADLLPFDNQQKLLREILSRIKEQPELERYTKSINNQLKAEVLTPVKTDVKIPIKDEKSNND